MNSLFPKINIFLVWGNRIFKKKAQLRFEEVYTVEQVNPCFSIFDMI